MVESFDKKYKKLSKMSPSKFSYEKNKISYSESIWGHLIDWQKRERGGIKREGEDEREKEERRGTLKWEIEGGGEKRVSGREEWRVKWKQLIKWN